MANEIMGELSTTEASRPTHEVALKALALVRDEQAQKLEVMYGDHRELLEAADRARRELDDQQALVEAYERAIAALLREDEAKTEPVSVGRASLPPSGVSRVSRPIRDIPQA